MALGMAYFCSAIFRCLISSLFGYTWFFRSYQTHLAGLGSFSHTRLDRVSVLLLAKYRYHSLSAYCDTVPLSKIMAVLLLDGAWIGSKWINSVSLSKKMSVFLLNWTTIGVCHLGRHSELVLTKCSVRGLFRNGQGAAELAFGSDTAALFLLILSSPLVLTPQSVRTQF
mgnify:CR=1 FL=1